MTTNPYDSVLEQIADVRARWQIDEYPFADEPAERACIHCEAVTRQTAVKVNDATYWTCRTCWNAEKELAA